MAQVQWKIREFPIRIIQRIEHCISWMRLLRLTLFYNEFTSWMVGVETLAEPMFWFVDRFARYLGPIFVTIVVMATTSVVVIFYTCLLPHEIELSLARTVFHLTFGHWLLVNIVFNYVMACFTAPGSPPPDVPEIVSICKRCISPKPPRTHHCSVCNKCILKMDHHCPWLNNCIGHYNHRYFFMFCCFMFTGTIYVSCTGYKHFAHHFYGEKELPFPGALYPLNAAYDMMYTKDKVATDQHAPAFQHNDGDIEIEYTDKMYHNAVIYEFVLCTGVAVALLLLIMWHVWMISAGETNVEVHINKKEKARLKKKGLVFRNPYHYGLRNNWKIFLGLTNGRTIWRHILLPSTHKPDSNGLSWPRAVYKMDKEKGLQLL